MNKFHIEKRPIRRQFQGTSNLFYYENLQEADEEFVSDTDANFFARVRVEHELLKNREELTARLFGLSR